MVDRTERMLAGRAPAPAGAPASRRHVPLRRPPHCCGGTPRRLGLPEGFSVLDPARRCRRARPRPRTSTPAAGGRPPVPAQGHPAGRLLPGGQHRAAAVGDVVAEIAPWAVDLVERRRRRLPGATSPASGCSACSTSTTCCCYWRAAAADDLRRPVAAGRSTTCCVDEYQDVNAPAGRHPRGAARARSAAHRGGRRRAGRLRLPRRRAPATSSTSPAYFPGDDDDPARAQLPLGPDHPRRRQRGGRRRAEGFTDPAARPRGPAAGAPRPGALRRRGRPGRRRSASRCWPTARRGSPLQRAGGAGAGRPPQRPAGARAVGAPRIPYVKYGGLRFLEAAHVKDLLPSSGWPTTPATSWRGSGCCSCCRRRGPGDGPPRRRRARRARRRRAPRPRSCSAGRWRRPSSRPARPAADAVVAALRRSRGESVAAHGRARCGGAGARWSTQAYANPAARLADLDALVRGRSARPPPVRRRRRPRPGAAALDRRTSPAPPSVDEDWLVLSHRALRQGPGVGRRARASTPPTATSPPTWHSAPATGSRRSAGSSTSA